MSQTNRFEIVHRTNELLAFLYISRGSAGETRSKLCFLQERPQLKELLLGKLPLGHPLVRQAHERDPS